MCNHGVMSDAGMCQTERRNGLFFFTHRRGTSLIAQFCSPTLPYMIRGPVLDEQNSLVRVSAAKLYEK